MWTYNLFLPFYCELKKLVWKGDFITIRGEFKILSNIDDGAKGPYHVRQSYKYVPDGECC